MTLGFWDITLESIATKIHWISSNLKTWHFLEGPVVKSPPFNAGDGGSIPDQGNKIPFATGQPNPYATTREAHTL